MRFELDRCPNAPGTGVAENTSPQTNSAGLMTLQAFCLVCRERREGVCGPPSNWTGVCRRGSPHSRTSSSGSTGGELCENATVTKPDYGRGGEIVHTGGGPQSMSILGAAVPLPRSRPLRVSPSWASLLAQDGTTRFELALAAPTPLRRLLHPATATVDGCKLCMTMYTPYVHVPGARQLLLSSNYAITPGDSSGDNLVFCVPQDDP